MDDITPVPFGALRAVFRDPEAESGLMVRPVVGFTVPPSTGGAAIFGGPMPDQMYSGRPPAANTAAVGIPVMVTRRGELRSVVTYQGPPESLDDVQDAAPATIGLTDGVTPGPEFLGLVQAHEEASEVFRAHVEAANTHRAAVEASRAAPERPQLPPRTVDAESADVAEAPALELPSPEYLRTSQALEEMFARVQSMTGVGSETVEDGEPEEWL